MTLSRHTMIHLSLVTLCYGTGEVIYTTFTDHSKNRRIHHTQTYDHSHTLDTTVHSLYTSPECPTSRTNDPIDNWDTYIQLRGAYMRLTRSDRLHSIILPDTQWYHIAHLPISTPETTCMLVDRNPRAYIMRVSQLPIEHRSFLFLSTRSLTMPVVSSHSTSMITY